MNGIAELSTSEGTFRCHNLYNVRPLAGASRRHLIAQIHELTINKAKLLAQLEAMAASSSSGVGQRHIYRSDGEGSDDHGLGGEGDEVGSRRDTQSTVEADIERGQRT